MLIAAISFVVIRPTSEYTPPTHLDCKQ